MPSVLTTADVTALRQLVTDLALPDPYELRRTTRTADDAGGTTEVEAAFENDWCSLEAGDIRPGERVVADRRGYQAPYVIELPYGTAATPDDVLVVYGRRFEVGGVLKGGASDLTARAICEERG